MKNATLETRKSSAREIRHKFFCDDGPEMSPEEAAHAAAQRVIREVLKPGRRRLKMTHDA